MFDPSPACFMEFSELNLFFTTPVVSFKFALQIFRNRPHVILVSVSRASEAGRGFDAIARFLFLRIYFISRRTTKWAGLSRHI